MHHNPSQQLELFPVIEAAPTIGTVSPAAPEQTVKTDRTVQLPTPAGVSSKITTKKKRKKTSTKVVRRRNAKAAAKFRANRRAAGDVLLRVYLPGDVLAKIRDDATSAGVSIAVHISIRCGCRGAGR